MQGMEKFLVFFYSREEILVIQFLHEVRDKLVQFSALLELALSQLVKSCISKRMSKPFRADSQYGTQDNYKYSTFISSSLILSDLLRVILTPPKSIMCI